MNGDQWVLVIALLATLILPLSALAGQKLNWKRSLVMALAWAWIFVLMVIVIRALGYR